MKLCLLFSSFFSKHIYSLFSVNPQTSLTRFFSLPPPALCFDIPVYATPTHSQDHHLHEVRVSNLLFLTFNFIILSIFQTDPPSDPFLYSSSFLFLTHAPADPLSSNLYLKLDDFHVDGEKRYSAMFSLETT